MVWYEEQQGPGLWFAQAAVAMLIASAFVVGVPVRERPPITIVNAPAGFVFSEPSLDTGVTTYGITTTSTGDFGGDGLVFEGAAGDATEPFFTIADSSGEAVFTVASSGAITSGASPSPLGWTAAVGGQRPCVEVCGALPAVYGLRGFNFVPASEPADTCICAGVDGDVSVPAEWGSRRKR